MFINNVIVMFTSNDYSYSRFSIAVAMAMILGQCQAAAHDTPSASNHEAAWQQALRLRNHGALSILLGNRSLDDAKAAAWARWFSAHLKHISMKVVALALLDTKNGNQRGRFFVFPVCNCGSSGLFPFTTVAGFASPGKPF